MQAWWASLPSRPPRWVAAAYLGVLLLGVAGWIAIVSVYTPTVEAGATAAGAGVAYLAFGANAWFLFAVLEQLRLTERQDRRSASPYVRIDYRSTTTTPDQKTVFFPKNYGQGIARELSMWRIVFRLDDSTWFVDFFHGRVEALMPNDPRDPNAIMEPVQTDEIGERAPFDIDDGDEFQMLSCFDELYRQHLRWFRRLHGNRLIELPFGHHGRVPDGGMQSPPGTDPAVEWLAVRIPHEPD